MADMQQGPPEVQLEEFLAKYDPSIQEFTRRVRSKLQQLIPGAQELVYDNYAGLVIGFGPSERPSEAILSIAVRPQWVTLCFIWGVKLPDPHELLQGSGNQVRNIRLATPEDLDAPAVRALIAAAVNRAKPPIDPARDRQLIIRSVSVKQRPRRSES